MVRAPEDTHCCRQLVMGLFGAALIAGFCSWVSPSEAYIEHPWCTTGRGWSGGLSCGFDDYAHCMENARLYTSNCVANPWIHPLPQAPPHAHLRAR